MNTETILKNMMLENTGIHLCDSGFDEGRHWQKNRKNGIMKGPQPVDYTLYNKSKEIEIEPYIPVYDFLCKNLIHNDKCLELETFMENEVEDLWCCWDYQDWVKENFDTKWDLINTYNGNCVLSQTLQFQIFNYEFDDYNVLQIHNGADIRGGYTKPRIFKVEYLEDFLMGITYADISCECGELNLTIDVDNYEYMMDDGSILDNHDIYNLVKINEEGELVCKNCKKVIYCNCY